jgi:hypothetical protein
MGSTRDDLHRLCAHVLAHRRADVSVGGHFGLRASPGGVATPAFGPQPEVLRLAGATLIREVGTATFVMPADGSTLDELARFCDVDLASAFSAGADTPPLGSPHEPLRLDLGELTVLYDWFDLGWRVLDAVSAGLPDKAERTTPQLWPEHFDAGMAVEVSAGRHVNLGFSPGDAFCAEPYAYVGPWDEERPGDPAFWNAPFGAYAPRSEARDAAACAAFIRTGLDLLVTAG